MEGLFKFPRIFFYLNRLLLSMNLHSSFYFASKIHIILCHWYMTMKQVRWKTYVTIYIIKAMQILRPRNALCNKMKRDKSKNKGSSNHLLNHSTTIHLQTERQNMPSKLARQFFSLAFCTMLKELQLTRKYINNYKMK